jgi:hypothetical protein
MRELMTKLPKEVIRIIISFSYNFQKPELLEDIQSFYRDREKTSQLYFKTFIIERFEIEPEDKNWFANDLVGFMNNPMPTMKGYTKNFYNYFFRNPFLTSKEAVKKYNLNLEKKEITTQINILFGLLLPSERFEFIKFFS